MIFLKSAFQNYTSILDYSICKKVSTFESHKPHICTWNIGNKMANIFLSNFFFIKDEENSWNLHKSTFRLDFFFTSVGKYSYYTYCCFIFSVEKFITPKYLTCLEILIRHWDLGKNVLNDKLIKNWSEWICPWTRRER